MRAAGHHILSIAETLPSINDKEVLAFATGREELLLTEDKDFGELVHLKRHAYAVVLLLRLNDMSTPDKIARVIMVLSHHGEELRMVFTTVDRRKVRFRRA